jgi:hypothetical protein
VEKPKGREDKRILKRMNRRPDFFEPERTYNARIPGQVIIIIPDESGMQRGPICRDRHNHDGGASHPFGVQHFFPPRAIGDLHRLLQRRRYSIAVIKPLKGQY